jgi:hypothetical protein
MWRLRPSTQTASPGAALWHLAHPRVQLRGGGLSDERLQDALADAYAPYFAGPEFRALDAEHCSRTLDIVVALTLLAYKQGNVVVDDDYSGAAQALYKCLREALGRGAADTTLPQVPDAVRQEIIKCSLGDGATDAEVAKATRSGLQGAGGGAEPKGARKRAREE